MFKKTLALTLFIILFIVSSVFAGALYTYPKFKAFDSNGDPLSGGKLYTYIAGTTTAKTTYSDKDLSTPNANPLILDSYGEGVVYGAGEYKFVLKDSDDSLFWTFDNLSAVGDDYLGSNYYFADASLADQGVAVGSLTVKDFVDSIGGTAKATIALTRGSTGNHTDYTFLNSETIPSNITLLFEAGARVSIVVGKTLTVNSPEHIISSTLQHIKTGNGSLSFTEKGTTYPEWWGIDGTADQVQFQAANDSLLSGGGICALKAYAFSATLNLSSNTHLYGHGKSSSITTTGNIYAISISGGAVYPNDIRGVLVEKLALYGTGTPAAGGGIYFQNAHECCFQNLWISDYNKTLFYGIHFAGAASNDTDNNIVRNNIITDTVDTSIFFYTTLAPAIEENVISGNIITSAGRNGISVVGDRNTIIGNTVEESGWHGIVLSNAQWNTVTGNTASENARRGISIESASSENTVMGNVCKDNDLANSAGWDGIACINGDRNVIIGNICYDNDQYEIYLDGASSNNIVMANECYGTDHVDTILDSGTGNLVLHNLEVLANFDTGISITTFTDADTTPSVLVNTDYPHVYGCANTGATTITQFHDGQAGQIIIVRIDSQTTIQDNANMFLAGGADFTGDANDNITLLCVAVDTWQEIARSKTFENIITLANDATPSIRYGSVFLTGGTTTITDFDDGIQGQIIRIIAEHTLIITDGTNIFLAGSANWNTMQATDTLTLVCKADLKWYELSRSDN